MAVNKRKKNSRMRGSHTHGWGAKKKHRGAGNRGGRGMAGTGKRGDANKPSYWHERYFGKIGFKKKGTIRKIQPINILDLELNIENYLQKNLISKKDNVYIIDLHHLGYHKLLGTGKVSHRYKIVTPYASAKSIKKVEAFGGEVNLTSNIKMEQSKE